MKLLKFCFAGFLLSISALSHAATWYASGCATATNINSVVWYPTSTGAGTGSGTALVWGAQANGDVLDANGCVGSITINVDPNGQSSTSTCTTSYEVTLRSNATNAGATYAFTYANTAGLYLHSNIATNTTATLTVTGATGTSTLCGNVTGTNTTASKSGVYDTRTSTSVFNVVGNLTAGTATGGRRAI